jgi:protein-tyrosine-phosphatase
MLAMSAKVSGTRVRSAGSEPAERINPVAAQAMAEVGIDITAEQPKILTTEAVKASDVVITMGCGDTCPFYPGKRYEDWGSMTRLVKVSRLSGRSVMRLGVESAQAAG